MSAQPAAAGVSGTIPTAHELARRALFAFLLTFILARALVFLIMGRRIPNLYFFLHDTHVHHLNYGIFLLELVAIVLFVFALDRLRERTLSDSAPPLLSREALALLGCALIVIASQRELATPAFTGCGDGHVRRQEASRRIEAVVQPVRLRVRADCHATRGEPVPAQLNSGELCTEWFLL